MLESRQHRRHILIVLAMVGMLFAPVFASIAGLPFTEDFSNNYLEDTSATTANWSTETQTVSLALRDHWYHNFPDIDTPGEDLGSESEDTQSAAFGDMDGDGDLDLVIGNRQKTNKVYFNTGGVFSSSGTGIFTHTDITYSIAIGDIDGDNDLDVIAGNAYNYNRSYKNDGSGNFTYYQGLGASDGNTRTVKLEDLDGDNDLDLVVGNYDQLNKIFLNNGSGSFTWLKDFGNDVDPYDGSLFNETEYFAIGDVDNDDDNDIVLCNHFRGAYLYRNGGNAGFSASGRHIAYTTNYCLSLYLEDIDADGDLDLLMGSWNGENQLYKNDGSGTFSTGINIGHEEDETYELAIGDVDGDGDLDVISGNQQNNRLYQNDGDGNFNSSGTVVGSDILHVTYTVVLGDIDDDGDIDLFSGNGGKNKLYRNAGSGGFNGDGIVLGKETDDTNSIAIGDIDGDNDLDMITGSDGLSRVYFNNGNDNFGPANMLGSNVGYTSAVKLGDLDGDDDLDLVMGNGSGALAGDDYYFINDGQGNFDNGTKFYSSYGHTKDMALGDVDHDGDLDVIAAKSGQKTRVYLNNGDGTFPNTYTEIGGDSTELTYDVELQDFDNDGDLDIVMGNYDLSDSGGHPGINRLYLNNGEGVFDTSRDISSDRNYTVSVVSGDVNGDGHPDLIVGNSGSEADQVFLNNGTGYFTLGSILPDAGSAYFALGDINADGYPDLVGGAFGQIRLYINDGYGSFLASSNIGISSDRTKAVNLSDIDSDGDLDIIIGNYGRNVLLRNEDHTQATKYKTQIGKVVSGKVNSSETDLWSINLLATDDANQISTRNTWIDYYMSNNGGKKWHQIKPGIPFLFPSAGDDIRWKAELHSLSPVITPSISQIMVRKAGVVVSVSTHTTSESGVNASLDIVLNDQPTDNVTIDIISNDTTEGNLSSSSLVFTPANYNTPQNIAIFSMDDSIDDGDVSYEVSLTASSTDDYYNGFPIPVIPMSNLDNDLGSFTISLTSSPSTSESGKMATFTVKPDSQPQSDVVLNLTSSDVTEGTVAPTQLTFTSDNWESAQTVTVTGVDDHIADDNILYTIIISAAVSTDPDYNGVNPPNVDLTNIDSDLLVPELTASLDSGDFNAAQTLVLVCADVESGCNAIYYTVNGATPTTGSAVYTEPLTISSDTTIKAFATDISGNHSTVLTRTYTFDLLKPTVFISNPANNALLNALSGLSGTANDADSGVSKVELQISGGGKSVQTQNGQLTTGPPEWVSAATGDGWAAWSYLSPVWKHDTEYTVTARATDNAGNTTIISHTFHYYNGEPAYTTLDLNLSSSSVIYGGEVDASIKLTKLGDPDADLAGSEVTLRITDPDYDDTVTPNPGKQYTIGPFVTNADGQVTVTGLGEAGNGLLPDGDDVDSDPDDLLFHKKGTWTLQAQYAGNLALRAADSPAQILLVGTSAGYAVIVEGKAENNEGLESHHKTGKRIYQTLLDRGFSEQNIFYFSYYYNDPDLALSDANDDGTPDRLQLGVGMDGLPSKADIQSVLQDKLSPLVAFNPAPIYLVMVDHGASDHRFLLGNDDISPTDLNNWLTDLEDDLNIFEPKALNELRVVILGYCYSGGFVDELSATNRLIITSAAANEESYKGPVESDGVRVGEYFLEELFQALGKGNTFQQAFIEATGKTETYTRTGGESANSENAYLDDAQQHPLLDDNGNGQGSNVLDAGSEDGQLAGQLVLGTGPNYDTNSLENPAEVAEVAPTSFLINIDNTAELWLKANDNGQVSQAYVEIREPLATLSSTGTGTEQLSTDFTKRILLVPGQNDASGTNAYTDRFYLDTDGFTEPGKYEIFYYVEDTETGNISPAKRSVVYKDLSTNSPPTYQDGDVSETWDLISPTDGATTKTAVIFDWENAKDPEDHALSYTLEIADSSDFDANPTFNGQTGVYRLEELNTSQAVVDATAGLKDQTTYYWRVKAIDIYGNEGNATKQTVSAQTWSFNTNNNNAPPGIIKGIIYSDLNSIRLALANIQADIGNYTGLTTTEINGEYLMLLPEGQIRLTISKSGYALKFLENINVPVSTPRNPHVELNIQLSEFVDSDGDGVGDTEDDFPNNIAATTDTDQDGKPDTWNASCDANCRSNSGLILDLDDDNDGMTDDYENANGLNSLVDDAADDLDGDGYSNFEEFEAGTAANDANDTPRKISVIVTILPLILEE